MATIGIVAGSGPDAGIDLWTKLLAATRHQLGDEYTGDADAPRVVIVSEPELGRSMELEQYEAEVWAALERTVRQLDPQVDHYAIACNTLHHFAPRLGDLGLGAHLVSAIDVSRAHVRGHGLETVGLMGARPVVDLGPWSPYRPLGDDTKVVTAGLGTELHQLIHDVKTHGPGHPGLADTWAEIVADTPADTILLACTELPLLPAPVTDKDLVDVTDLIAEELARLART